nr:MAG TPA: hypothetical protein [Ackermannviridae sp.]DAW82306.1 MAG TPA: hypothetical protein [Bacteriophage sp.]
MLINLCQYSISIMYIFIFSLYTNDFVIYVSYSFLQF